MGARQYRISRSSSAAGAPANARPAGAAASRAEANEKRREDHCQPAGLTATSAAAMPRTKLTMPTAIALFMASSRSWELVAKPLLRAAMHPA